MDTEPKEILRKESTSVKLIELLQSKKNLKESLMNVLIRDSDFNKLAIWYLLWVIVLIGFLFYKPIVSVVLGLVLLSNFKVMMRMITTKLSGILILLKNIQSESSVITYNKNLTNAISLLYHNNIEFRNQGKDIIFKEYPQHIECIYASERMFEDLLDEEVGCSRTEISNIH